eukprot:4103379-Pyramimonas_sp.AAC.1
MRRPEARMGGGEEERRRGARGAVPSRRGPNTTGWSGQKQLEHENVPSYITGGEPQGVRFNGKKNCTGGGSVSSIIQE